MALSNAILWWTRFGLAATFLLLLPWLFAAGAACKGADWLTLALTAPGAPAVERPVAPGLAGLPRRLWLLVNNPPPQASAPRPEIERLAHRRAQHRARRAAKVWLVSAAIAWFFSTAGLIACLGLAAERLSGREAK